MISNLRISVAELVIWALLAAAGLTWISFRVVDGAAWLMGWLRDRVTPLLEDDYYEEDQPLEEVQRDWDSGERVLVLAPERTWEQMTSHQYPLDKAGGAGSSPVRVPGLEPVFPGVSVDSMPALTAERERRAPWWEVQQRAAYESLGLDYPSGLMARVRELTP